MRCCAGFSEANMPQVRYGAIGAVRASSHDPRRCLRARPLWACRWRFACERLIETMLTAGRERCRVGLRRAYWVAQVCHAEARDYRRVAKDGWGAGEVVEESNSGAKQNRRDVDADFVEESSIQ
jgi:hypothetical protein